ncbi:MAG TPA: HAD-IA family hydrolase [Longimicrobiales bacterium]|nr:HAD-IA family hydrolase [Longimicrobiales bacterium]
MTPRWESVLFDLDGTLADTVPLILACYRHTMTVHRGAPLPDELWLRHVGRPLRDSMLDFGRDAAEADALRETYIAFQREAHDRMVRPFPGIVEAVRELRDGGVPLGVVTSKTREMALRTLEVCGLGDAFPVVVTADEVTLGKPHPEPVHLALRMLSVAPGRGSVFVGDSPHDLVSGRAAGVRTVGVTWGAATADVLAAEAPDHLIRSVAELRALRP